MSEKLNEEEFDYKLTEEEEKLFQKYLEEYNDIYQKIFLLSRDELMENIKKKVEITIKSKIKNYTPESITKIEQYLMNKIYIPDLQFAQIIKKNIEKRSKREIALHYFRGEIIPHCDQDKKDDYYVHSCGERFQFFRYKFSNNSNPFILNTVVSSSTSVHNMHYDYILYCQNCNMIYKSSLIKFYCNKTKTEFYSKLLNKENDTNNCYATWKKYHCNAIINDTMKCQNCHEILYYLKEENMLFCENCNKKMKPKDIIWKCLICKNEFQAEAKIYNPLEYKSLKICVKDAVTNKIYARPEYLGCKCIYDINKIIFFHKENCRGELYLGEINNEKVVVCGKCDSLGIYEGYRWTCPQCLKKFKTKKREISVSDTLGLKDHFINDKENNKYKNIENENSNKKNKFNLENSNFWEGNSEKKNSYNVSLSKININSLPNISKYKSDSIKETRNFTRNNLKIMNYSQGKDSEFKKSDLLSCTIRKKIDAFDLFGSQKSSNDDSISSESNLRFLKSYRKPHSKNSHFSKNSKEPRKEKIINLNSSNILSEDRESTKSFSKKIPFRNEHKNNSVFMNKNNNSLAQIRIIPKKEKNKTDKVIDTNFENPIERPKNRIIVKTLTISNQNTKQSDLLSISNENNNNNNPISIKKPPKTNKKFRNNNININININNTDINQNNVNPNNIIVNNLTINNNKEQVFPKEIKLNSLEHNNNYHINNINTNININSDDPKITSARKISQKYSNLSDYKLIKQIGKGSFGSIFMVENENHQLFALKKLIATNFKDIKTLEHEYQILLDIQECGIKINLVQIYGIETKQLDPTTFVMYVLMELANTDWEKEILYRSKIKKYYSENELMKIISSLITTFAKLQRENISHRDIKPQNILIFKDTETYKLADFGEAKELISDKKPTDRQTLRGTELYMSPILFYALRGRKVIKYVNHNPYKSDLFSFGLCSLFAATLCFDSIYDIRELKNNTAIRFIIQKYLESRYSNVVINIICSMLDVNENSRNDFIGMEKEIKNIGY